MIALLLAAATSLPATPPPALAPAAVLARYEAALKSLEEPRVFTFTYTLQQTGPRTLDQTHRVFRSGNDERDETLAVNGNRSRKPLVRIFHGRRYRYAAAVLAPKRTAYAFSYAGPHRDGKHLDYVFTLVRKGAPGPVTFTGVTVDGVTFLPQSVAFVSRAHGASGTVSFGKADRYWVARGATAQAKTPGGIAREQLAFAGWRFPKALPRSTFSVARPLPTLPPALP